MAAVAGHTDREIEFAWTAHPARQAPTRGIIGVGMVGLIAFAVFLGTRSGGWAVGSVVILILALNRFFFASRFEITADEIIARYPFRRVRAKWCDLRRFLRDDFGGYLSTRAQRSFLDRYRGMHLLFAEPSRDEAVRTIRQHMNQRTASLQSDAEHSGSIMSEVSV